MHQPPLPLGSHNIALVVNDGVVDSYPDAVVITVKDTTAPDFSADIDPALLWPPNHKMIEIATVLTASDVCDPAPSIRLVNISMDEGDETLTFDPEYDETLGDGHTTDDIRVNEDGSILLRAERAGAGDGRVYTLTYEAVDASGNVATAIETVVVPHSQ